MSVVLTAWNLGLIVGPAVGGKLTNCNLVSFLGVYVNKTIIITPGIYKTQI